MTSTPLARVSFLKSSPANMSLRSRDIDLGATYSAMAASTDDCTNWLIRGRSMMFSIFLNKGWQLSWTFG